MKKMTIMLSALCLAAAAPASHAVNCVAGIAPSNPDSIYELHGETVTDTRTGLVWKRCSEGQSWTGSICSGTASTHAWSAALTLAEDTTFAGHSDWRLPNLKELRSLVEECRINPAINDTVFPNTPPSSTFWSGSPYANDSDFAWFIDSFVGGADYNVRSNAESVRLVRAGQ